MHKLSIPVVLAAFAFSVSPAQAGDAAAGKLKSSLCAACHGANGISANDMWPNLAGQHPSYLAKQLRAFRDGQRENVLMSPMAMGLSDQDIEDLAAYFAAQTLRGGETDPGKLAEGQRVYRAGNLRREVAACAGCHGPAGRGNPTANYPALQGQQATYVAAQLRAYRSGARATDPNQMMRNVAAGLSDEEIDAVASYVHGLR
jgi:cytochrome c553